MSTTEDMTPSQPQSKAQQQQKQETTTKSADATQTTTTTTTTTAPPNPTAAPQHDAVVKFPAKLKLLSSTAIIIGTGGEASSSSPSTLFALSGSVLDYEGDAIVNAANNGGVTGFGIDELVNRAGGLELKEARRKFNGIETGCAKTTTSFNHKKTKFIVHAVGPVFRDNAMSPEPVEEKMQQLQNAYFNSCCEAARNGARDIAFCLISCGVFRGRMPLEKVMQCGIDGIVRFFTSPPGDDALFSRPVAIGPERNRNGGDDDDERSAGAGGNSGRRNLLKRACIVAFTPEEQKTLKKLIDALNK